MPSSPQWLIAKRPWWTAAALAACVVAVTGPALAVCAICNATVRLDANLASCFAERVEAELGRLRASTLGFAIVDLSDCPDAPESRSALPTGARRAAPTETLDVSFIGDAKMLECLGNAIATGNVPLDPSYLFDLTQICP